MLVDIRRVAVVSRSRRDLTDDGHVIAQPMEWVLRRTKGLREREVVCRQVFPRKDMIDTKAFVRKPSRRELVQHLMRHTVVVSEEIPE